MKNKKKESKLFFDNTQKKCDEILEHTNKLVLKNVFIEKQQSITTLFKEKMFAFKSFLKICEEIYFYNESNKFIQENIVEISLEISLERGWPRSSINNDKSSKRSISSLLVLSPPRRPSAEELLPT